MLGISSEDLLNLKRECDELRKNFENAERLTDALWREIVEKQKIIRSLSENLAMVDEQKKNPAELVDQNIVRVIKKYDKEVLPKVDQLRETKINRIHQSLDELNGVLETFNYIASYVVACDTKIDKADP